MYLPLDSLKIFNFFYKPTRMEKIQCTQSFLPQVSKSSVCWEVLPASAGVSMRELKKVHLTDVAYFLSTQRAYLALS